MTTTLIKLVTFSHVNQSHTVCLRDHNQTARSLRQSEPANDDPCRSLSLTVCSHMLQHLFAVGSDVVQRRRFPAKPPPTPSTLSPDATPKAKDIWRVCNEVLKGLQLPIRKHGLHGDNNPGKIK